MFITEQIQPMLSPFQEGPYPIVPYQADDGSGGLGQISLVGAGGAALSTGGMALTALGAGAAFGPIGLAAGAIVGVVGGLLSSGKAKKAAKKQQKKEMLIAYWDYAKDFLTEMGYRWEGRLSVNQLIFFGQAHSTLMQTVDGMAMQLRTGENITYDLTQAQAKGDVKKITTLQKKVDTIRKNLEKGLNNFYKQRDKVEQMVTKLGFDPTPMFANLPAKGQTIPGAFNPSGYNLVNTTPTNVAPGTSASQLTQEPTIPIATGLPTMKAGFEGMLPILLIGGAALFLLGGKGGRAHVSRR